ncbi:MAG: DNA-binding transcriptional regulator [Rhodopirellula sp.]|nr:DNA-binding transcriptional regulator [Rhodopirellula sp.]
MEHRRSVALLIETSNAYARGLLEGIIDYIRHHERWSVVVPEQERGASPPGWLAGWKGDGIIARIETDEIATAMRRTKRPVVDVSAARHLPGIPWVETDDEAITKMAVEHLVERGFRHLAFCGDAGFNWSIWRQQHFERLVREAGCECHLHQSIPRSDPKYSWNREKRGLANWLKQLPRPIGIMACYDIKAQQLLDVCRELNIAVPEEVAVLGVDNDRLLCDLADPPLTSVICNSHRTGYEAASLLDRMMSGENVGAESVLVKPLGIETRQSTDILAIDDPDVAAAVRFIRENASNGINISDVLREVPLSRRVLEKRFHRILGRTPHEEITRLRIDRVKRLLTETSLPLTEIARRTGYRHDEYLSVAFKKLVGMPPSSYRKAEQRHLPSDETGHPIWPDQSHLLDDRENVATLSPRLAR